MMWWKAWLPKICTIAATVSCVSSLSNSWIWMVVPYAWALGTQFFSTNSPICLPWGSTVFISPTTPKGVNPVKNYVLDRDLDLMPLHHKFLLIWIPIIDNPRQYWLTSAQSWVLQELEQLISCQNPSDYLVPLNLNTKSLKISFSLHQLYLFHTCKIP